MANVSAIVGVVNRIAAALIEEGKCLYGVEDHVHALKRELGCMQEHFQPVNAAPDRVKKDGQLSIFTQIIGELAIRAEDGINTYVVDVGSKFYSKNLFMKLVYFPSHFYQVCVLTKEITDFADDFKVLAIVGARVGSKTTLASLIYGHDRVESWFAHLAFVSISQKWCGNDVLHGISREAIGSSKSPSSEGKLMRRLHDFMKDKPFLVALDDIWYKETWDVMCPIFPCSKGCRVLLTSRIEYVFLHVDNKYTVYELQLLTMDQT